MTGAGANPRALVVWTIAMVAVAIVLVWALYLVRGALLIIYVSALFAIGFSPLVRLIEKQRLLPIGTRRFPRWLAILFVYVTFLGALVGVGLLVLPPLARQARELWRALPGAFARVQDFLLARGVLDEPLTLKDAVTRAPGGGTDAVGAVVGAIWGFVGGVFGILTILILTFYFLVEAESIFQSFLRLFPRERRTRIAALSREITVKVSAWLMGQLLLAIIIGGTAFVFLWALGVPYFYVLALVAAIGEMIPVIGPILAAIPAIIVGFTMSPQVGIAVSVFYVVQQQIENHLLVPKIMARQVGVSAVTVIVALLIGGSLLGVIGAILAVPTAAILQVLFQEITSLERDA